MAKIIAGMSAIRLEDKRLGLRQRDKRREGDDRDIGADRDECAMAEVHDVHQTEDQRKA